jgi:guanyl-specific ribonuclease Sa
MLTVVATVLLSSAFLAMPTMKVANAQGNETQGNQTKGGANVDQWIKVLKQDNPTLSDIQQDSKVKDAIGKIKAMEDPKEAVKTLDALYALQQLMNLQSLKEGQ